VVLPAAPAGSGSVARDRIVGYETQTSTSTVSVAADTAFQTLLTGTDGDDVVTPAESADPMRQTVFRGVVETGAGNDSVQFVSARQGPWGDSVTRYDDWGMLDGGYYNWMVINNRDRGLGAWIDLGDGDDQASGTDGNDFIIGGRGSDWMDGQAGADTYYISASPGDVDHISDLASFNPTQDITYLCYGGRLDRPNLDTVEFDGTVALQDLSYRWGSMDEQTGMQVLELMHQGELFLQVDYAPSVMEGLTEAAPEVSMPGVERFRFADGSVLTLRQLLDAVPAAQVQAPVQSPAQAQAQALVDAMAAFAPPDAGQSTLLPDSSAQLQPVIATGWQ
jgi:Ca2+-binding RTX toxin-like protein